MLSKLQNVKSKEQRAIKRYNVDNILYESILKKQNSSCAICGVKSNKEHWANDKAQRFDIDHCHKTNIIRGLLCRRCNIFIGYIDKDVSVLKKVKEYLDP